MKFLIDNWFYIMTALLSGGMLAWPRLQASATGGTLTTSAAVLRINREKGVVIDVSEPAEFEQEHVAGARNVPFGQLDGHKQLPSNKALPLVVVCPSGARAGRAAALLRKAGYENAQALTGGTRAWREAQLPVERKGA
ncbi:rhodanese-like domain-containing protein [Roseateles sp.]|uniref:rhodanese-like domain-containing protein n=1 Tax=Roseateles sp. TaxID=1971397 RepID=UPI0039240738